MEISTKPDDLGAAYRLSAFVPSGSTIAIRYYSGFPRPNGVPRVKALYQKLHNHFLRAAQAVERQQADEKRGRQKDKEDEERKLQKEQEDDILRHL